MRFTKKIARKVIQKQIDHTIDSVIGITDPDYNLGMEGNEFEQNFTEDMEELNIVVTEKRMKICFEEYDKIRMRAIKYLQSLQT